MQQVQMAKRSSEDTPHLSLVHNGIVAHCNLLNIHAPIPEPKIDKSHSHSEQRYHWGVCDMIDYLIFRIDYEDETVKQGIQVGAAE